MNEGLIGQLFGQNLQSFPESTCQTEYMDILGGDMNDGRLPGQRTRCHSIKDIGIKRPIYINYACIPPGLLDSARNAAKIPKAVISLLGTG